MSAPLFPPIEKLKIVDVGAMAIDGLKDPYERLRTNVTCEIVGFEAVTAECDKLNAMNRVGHTYLPFVVGDGSQRTFYECNYPMTSSLFEPNTALLELFQNIENLTRVIRTSTIETKRLDDLPQVVGCDYLKLDVQGGELLVLEGAQELLKNVLVIHTEVEFVELYKNQPLFSHIDLFLRARGFVLHRLNNGGRAFKPLILRDNVNSPGSQFLWGDAIYVRDFMALDNLTSQQLLKLAVILHQNYNSVDLAAYVLRVHDLRTGSSFRDDYMRRLVTAA